MRPPYHPIACDDCNTVIDLALTVKRRDPERADPRCSQRLDLAENGGLLSFLRRVEEILINADKVFGTQQGSPKSSFLSIGSPMFAARAAMGIAGRGLSASRRIHRFERLGRPIWRTTLGKSSFRTYTSRQHLRLQASVPGCRRVPHHFRQILAVS
jgi:hypothetical protein